MFMHIGSTRLEIRRHILVRHAVFSFFSREPLRQGMTMLRGSCRGRVLWRLHTVDFTAFSPPQKYQINFQKHYVFVGGPHIFFRIVQIARRRRTNVRMLECSNVGMFVCWYVDMLVCW